jgi:hypothetical protein
MSLRRVFPPAVGRPEPEAAGPTDPYGDNSEPRDFGDAVQAAALMLGLVTAVAAVGFLWERNRAEAAHDFAVSMVERIAEDGDRALMPAWSGWGQGPSSATAQETFRALGDLGGLAPSEGGACKVASRFAICSGTRYRCQVSGVTPAGPVQASIGLCDDGTGSPYSFDALDLTVPMTGTDAGNRAAVDIGRDGLIRYGTTPLPAEPPPVRLHQRAPLGPLRW